MSDKPISLDVLKDMSDSGLVSSILARKLPNGSGYHLIARINKDDRVLHKTRHADLPRLFKSLDTIADNCNELGFRRFEVVNL